MFNLPSFLYTHDEMIRKQRYFIREAGMKKHEIILTQPVNASLRRLFWPGAVSQQVRRSAATPSLALLAPEQNSSPLWMRERFSLVSSLNKIARPV